MSAPNDQHGYVTLGIFIFALVLIAIGAGASLVAWAISGVPFLLGLAIAMVAGGVGFIVVTIRERRS